MRSTFPSIHPNGILVFDRNANGDVAPKRVLSGPDTQLRGSAGHGRGSGPQSSVCKRRNAMLIFDRTASGNTKPKAVIRGPKSGMGRVDSFQVYSREGSDHRRRPGYASIVSAPGVSTIMATFLPAGESRCNSSRDMWPSGIALDPAHKEVILSAAGQRVPPVAAAL